VCCRTDRYYDSDYGTSIVSAFVIENHGKIKEKFSYEVPFNKTTQQSLVAYSQANYGPDAVFRYMTDEEKIDFIAPAQVSIWDRLVRLPQNAEPRLLLPANLHRPNMLHTGSRSLLSLQRGGNRSQV